jgi:beta-xylosidase
VSPQTSDEFARESLGLQWQWQANFDKAWSSLSARPGWLRLSAVPLPVEAVNLWEVPNILLQKLPAPKFTVTTRLDAGGLLPNEEAGLVVMGMNYSYLAVVRTEHGFRLERTLCVDAAKDNEETEEDGVDLTSGAIYLRVLVEPEAECRFSYSIDGRQFTDIGEPFKATVGKWIGAKLGLFAVSLTQAQHRGFADFDWFRLR